MRAYLLTFVLVTFFIQISFGQNNPFLDLQEVDLLESDCELKNWYEDFSSYRKKNKNYEDHIKILTQKINLIDSNNCIRNEQLDTLKGRLYFHLGVAYRITGLVEKSHVSYNKAFDVFKLYSNNKSLASTCRKLGSIWRLKKDFNKANAFFENSQRICIENKFNKQLHKTYNETIINYYRWDRPKDTIAVNDIYLKAKAIPNIDKEDRLALEANRALFFLAIENYEKALNIYFNSEVEYRKLLEDKELNKSDKKIKELQTNMAKTLLNIAKIQTNLNQFNETDMQFIKIEELIEQDKVYKNDKYFYQDYLIAKAAYYEKQDQLEKALDEYQKVLQSISINFIYKTIYQNPSPKQIFGNPYLLTTLADKAEVFKKMYAQTNNKTNLTHALNCYELSYTAADQMRKEYSFEEANRYMSAYTYGYYEKAIELCLQLAKAYPTQKEEYKKKAFEISQRSSMKTLFWEINNRAADSHLDNSTKKEKGRLQRKLTELENELRNIPDSAELVSFRFKLRNKLDQIDKNAKEKIDGYFDDQFCHLSDFFSEHKTIQSNLKANQAVLNYFYGDSLIYCFLLTQDKFKIIEIENPELISKKVIAFRKAIEGDMPINNLAYQLYQKLLAQPLKQLTSSFFNTINNLIIIPDGILNALPFEVLQQSEKNQNYLINDYTISYDLHSYFLTNSKNQTPAKNIKTIAFSVKDFSNYEPNGILPNLDFSDDEVESLAAQLKVNTIYNTTKQQFIQNFGKFDIIHISTHASADTLAASNSRIYFSRNNENESDDILSRDEILNHKCTAEMIVLSACETGFGKQNKGEGVASLARAFRTIGSKSEVMSLWKVNEYSTAEIVVDFYKNLKKGLPKNEALRQAKLNFINNSSANYLKLPKYWAGLVLQGNVNRLF